MPYREVTMLEVKEVLRLWKGKVEKKQIARQVGVSRNTVRAYVRVAERCGLRPTGQRAVGDEEVARVLAELRCGPARDRGEGWRTCEGERSFIAELLARPVRLRKVWRLLRRKGARVSYATLHRFAVLELGFGRKSATIPVAEGKPGEEIQLDTGWVVSLEPDERGRRRRMRAWIFTPSVSRYRFVWPCEEERTESAIEACEAAWEFYGGVFGVLIPDNTKAIVQKADGISPRLNETFLEYSQSRGFVVDAARSRHPKDKAKTERAVQDVRNDCFGGERLRTLEDARRRARVWCESEYGMRRHSTTGRMPREHFEAEEKGHLLPGPTTPYDVPVWCRPKVARDHFAQVAGALYSLPTAYVGERLQAKADRFVVRFYEGTRLVKTHPRVPRGRRSVDPSDFPCEKVPYAMRDVRFLEQEAAGYGEAVGRFAKALLEGPLPWTRMRRVYALRSLVRRYGDARVNEACTTALAAGMVDVRRLARMLEIAHPAPVQGLLPLALPRARYLRPASAFTLQREAGAIVAEGGAR